MSLFTLEMIQGYDRAQTPFTAFVVCTQEEKTNLQKAKSQNIIINFKDYKVVYSIKGHQVNDSLQNLVLQYVNEYNNLPK